jgi:hypothetical protein
LAFKHGHPHTMFKHLLQCQVRGGFCACALMYQTPMLQDQHVVGLQGD